LSLSPELRAVKEAASRRDRNRRDANPELVAAIAKARKQGWTWQEIADVVGTSRQAMQQLASRRA
jgi:hypothetical protein